LARAGWRRDGFWYFLGELDSEYYLKFWGEMVLAEGFESVKALLVRYVAEYHNGSSEVGC